MNGFLKQLGEYLPKKYFSMSVLPYWCILALDCATIVLAGMWSVYMTLGGMVVIGSFWDHIYIWVFSLPIFVLAMHMFKSYRGVVRKSMKDNIVSCLLAMVLGGLVLQAFCEFVPNVIFPFRPALRATALMVLVSSLLQTFYRFIAKRVFYVNSQGKVHAKNIFRPRSKRFGVAVDNSMAERKRINLCLAHMSEAELEKKYVKEAFDTNWVVPLGPNVNAFEQDLKEFVSSGNECEVAALASGTSAVHLALVACGVQPGDEVCVQSFTFCASSNPIVYMGAVPVFIDSETDTWNMDPDLLETAIKDRIEKTGKKPKAIIPVALYGMPYKADRILEVGNKYGIPVIEDAAEGFGSRYKGKVLGSFGRFGVLSFNGNKMITTSGGGALVCNSDSEKSGENVSTAKELKNNVLWYATQARESYPYYQHEAIGFNYRMSNVCAGIGRGQMTVANDHIAHHKHVQQMYETLLEGVKGITVHKQPASKDYDSNYWLCTITLDPSLKIKGQENAYKQVVQGAVGGAAGVIHLVDSPTTDCQPNDNVEALRVIMDKAQIEARPVWKPMHKQPVYANAPAYVNGVSESLFKIGMCLPAGPYVSDEDIEYIVETIKGAIEE